MNVGQILETHLGWGARQLGQMFQMMVEQNKPVEDIRKAIKGVLDTSEQRAFVETLSDTDLVKFVATMKGGLHFASPVFEGAREEEIRTILMKAGVSTTGQSVLFDGRSGDAFDQDVTVGVLYMLKLHHLVDDKIHARSIGPYSLVTQQPLGGKAQFGGQRLGEMEVWAMEAYGAAYALQEFLTVKSDDVQGRTRMYEAIVKGENVLECGIPESFNVLMKELQALCLDIEMLQDDKAAATV
jgi:DNA-directed RNA polymerase subunit beta